LKGNNETPEGKTRLVTKRLGKNFKETKGPKGETGETMQGYCAPHRNVAQKEGSAFGARHSASNLEG